MTRAIQLFTTCVVAALCVTSSAQERREPVYRVSNAKVDASDRQQARHPLDEALDIARTGLKRIRDGDPARRLAPIHDYTCTMIKRERVDGKLNEQNYMYCKFRNRHTDANGNKVPFSVYMYFLVPDSVKGREVIYVEGKNNNKLCAREGGKRTWLPTVWLKPAGSLAMKGQLYPITESGLENMVLKLIERGTAEKKHPDCVVNKSKAMINKRRCTLLQVKHPTRRPQYEFSLAQIFIDDELQLPVRYVAYDWPRPGQKVGEIQEEYTHLNIKVNVGLTDEDFNPHNANYNFFKKKK